MTSLFTKAFRIGRASARAAARRNDTTSIPLPQVGCEGGANGGGADSSMPSLHHVQPSTTFIFVLTHPQSLVLSTCWSGQKLFHAQWFPCDLIPCCQLPPWDLLTLLFIFLSSIIIKMKLSKSTSFMIVVLCAMTVLVLASPKPPGEVWLRLCLSWWTRKSR